MNKITKMAISLASVLSVGSIAFGSISISPAAQTLDSGMGSAVNSMFGYIQMLGFIVGAVMIAYAGFKYLTAGAGKKAEAKETLVPIIIGAVLIILAPAIFSAIWTALGGT